MKTIIFIFAVGVAAANAVTFQNDYLVELNNGDTTTITNPNYPNKYPVGVNTRYQVTAPAFCKVQVTCTIQIDYSGGGCTANDIFGFLTDGTVDISGTSAGTVCVASNYQFTSQYNSVTLGYISTNYGGIWTCGIKVVSSGTCDCGRNNVPRIVGGNSVAANTYPFQAALWNTDYNAISCMAVILTPRCLVTAAHCMVPPYNNTSTNYVLVGRSFIQEPNCFSYFDTPYSRTYTIYGFRSHEYYNPNTKANDIALVYTNNRMVYNAGVGGICTPPTGYVPPANSVVNVTGWGTTSYGGPKAKYLQVTYLSIVDLNTCASQFASSQPPNPIYDSQFCTYGQGQRDACQYDSGSAVFYRNNTRIYLAGTVSYGIGCATSQPSVNTLFSAYLDWVFYYGESISEYCFY